MNKKQRKAIVYCRVSSTEQVQGTSLSNQKEACLEYAERKNLNVVKTFTERGESATAANRTEFLKALEYCREHKDTIDAFIVWKIDRFARNTTDHFAVRAKLIQYGATLHSVTEPITDDPQGKLMETMLAGFAEFENEVRKQRCQAGMVSRLKEGIWCWKPPIGYTHSKKRRDKRKTHPDEPDPERFYLIQKALKLYAKGEYNISELTAKLNEWGFKTREGKDAYKQLVETILKNKFYAGILENPWNGEEYMGKHQPMITKEEFYQIQAVKDAYSNNATAPRLHLHPDFPLRRFVRCAECGEDYTASWSTGRNKKYAYYRCNSKACKNYSKNIPRQELEEAFITKLEEVAPTEEFMRVFEAAVLDEWDRRHKTLTKEKERYNGHLERLETKKERVLQLRVEGEISKEEFSEIKDKIENEITALQISSNEISIDRDELQAGLTYAKKYMCDLARQWQDMSVKQQQRLQDLVFPEGLEYEKTAGTFGTAALPHIFELNRQFDGDESMVVAGVGFEPTTSGL